MRRLFLLCGLCFIFISCASNEIEKYEYTSTGYSIFSFEDARDNAMHRMCSERPDLLTKDVNLFEITYFNPFVLSINDAYHGWLFGDPESKSAKSTKTHFSLDAASTSLRNSENYTSTKSEWEIYRIAHVIYECNINYLKQLDN